MNNYWVNFDLQGNDVEKQWITDERFRVDVQTEAALAFLKRNHEDPFFLYLSWYAPMYPSRRRTNTWTVFQKISRKPAGTALR
jgi:hypothetical protein